MSCSLSRKNFVLHELRKFDKYFMFSHNNTEASPHTSSAGKGGMLNLGLVKKAIFSLQTKKKSYHNLLLMFYPVKQKSNILLEFLLKSLPCSLLTPDMCTNQIRIVGEEINPIKVG